MEKTNLTSVGKTHQIMTPKNEVKWRFTPFASKLSNFVIAFVAGCLSLSLYSCESDEVEPVSNSGVYHTSQNHTRSVDGGYWEQWDKIKFQTNEKVNTPWNSVYVSSAVPHDILVDVKYEDGWDLIFPQLKDSYNDYCESDIPYLIFHNKYTGILKVFCYVSQNGFHPNNHGVWQIKVDGNSTSLFAFQNNPITRISEKQNKTYYVSNITDNITKGFSVGWNCFQIELAYDPDQSGMLHISALASNTAELSVSGNLDAETKGLMTVATGKESYGNGIAKVAGDEAGKWITKKINDKTILGIPSSLISEGVKAIVSGGVGSILGAFTGLFKKDNNTAKSLQLTTNGKITSNGKIEFNTTTSIPDLKFNIDPNRVGYLGVWGLEDEPTLLFSPYAVRKSIQEYSNGYTREYLVNIINTPTKAKLRINPSVSRYCKSETDYYQSSEYTRRNIWGSMGVLGRDPAYGQKVYDDLYKPNFYMIADVAFLGEEDVHIPINQFEAPMEVFIPNVPNGPKGAIPNLRYNSRYVASVGVHLTLPNGSEAYSFHKCFPKLDWNLSEYDNGLYQYFYPCEPVIMIN